MKLGYAVAVLTTSSLVSAFTTTSSRRPFAVSTSSRTTPTLYGILEEVQSDAYDLSGASDDGVVGGNKIKMNDAFEMFLAELVFSTNNPRVDILNNLDKASDPEFVEWLDNKVQTSPDPEERVALRDLHEMIADIVNQVEVSRELEAKEAAEAEQAEADRLAAAEAQAEQGRKLSNADVLRRAAAIDASTSLDAEVMQESSKKVNFYDSEITPEVRKSYERLCKRVLPPYKPGDTPASIVFKNYSQFDAQFIKVLKERVENGDEDANAILEALAVEQQNRVAAATESLKSVLALGEPSRMAGAIVKLAREGKVDEPFLLLLEANAEQAKAAGAHGPAELMLKLRKRALEEKDKQASSKEIKLIRQLLRTDDNDEREKLLTDAFTPRENLLVAGTAENARKAVDGEAPEQEKPMPDVPPPDFINACKAVLLNFGNLELGDDDDGTADLATKIKRIASEAEVVATRIYGKGMSLREQQDRAWKEDTTSIFDLERMEIEAERMGEKAPWTNPDAPDDYIPGFDSQGRMQVGGG